MTGFYMNEVMTGTHRFVDSDEELKLEFDVNWGHDNILKFLDMTRDDFMVADLSGYVSVGGLVENAPCKGDLILDYFGNHTITYEFEFAVDSELYYFKGEKVNIKPWNILTSHTTCFGTIVNSKNELISRAVVYFRWRTLFKFLSSFRLFKSRYF